MQEPFGALFVWVNTQYFLPVHDMQIIHLSDTHIGTLNMAARMDLLVDDILSFGNPATTTIVHTGDLIDAGTPKQIEQGRAVLQRLADSGRRVLLAPGNHDYGNKWKTDPVITSNYKNALGDFLFNGAKPEFPVLTLTDEVAFIGLDSNEGQQTWLRSWFAEGSLGAIQIKKLNDILDLPEVQKRTVVVYLHHQPFIDAFSVQPDIEDIDFIAHIINWNSNHFLRLEDAFSLVATIRDRIDIMLFGHRHLMLDHQPEAIKYGFKMALDGSSSTAVKTATDRMRYRVIDTQTGGYEVRFVKFPPGDTGEFSIR